MVCLMLIMNYLCEKWCSEHKHFEFFSVSVYFFIFLYIGEISTYKISFFMTITYMSFNDQVSPGHKIAISYFFNTFIYKNNIR